ncbi:hypothetical protein [Ferruginibacter sp.]
MKKHSLLFAFICCCIYCSCSSNDTAQPIAPVKKDAAKKIDTANNKQSTPVDAIAVVSKKQVMGVWGTTDKEFVTVKFTYDSIFYTEHFESYKYVFKGDSIHIFYPDFELSGKVFLIKDTMAIRSEDGISKYVKLQKIL